MPPYLAALCHRVGVAPTARSTMPLLRRPPPPARPRWPAAPAGAPLALICARLLQPAASNSNRWTIRQRPRGEMSAQPCRQEHASRHSPSRARRGGVRHGRAGRQQKRQQPTSHSHSGLLAFITVKNCAEDCRGATAVGGSGVGDWQHGELASPQAPPAAPGPTYLPALALYEAAARQVAAAVRQRRRA